MLSASHLIYTATMAFTPPTIAKVDIRKHIAIVDTGIELSPVIEPYICTDGLYDLTGTGIEDRHGHGTNIAGLIAKKLDYHEYCLDIIKYYNLDVHNLKESILHLDAGVVDKYSKLLLQLKPAYLNMSIEGAAFSAQEYTMLKTLTAQGTKVFVAGGNDTIDFSAGKCEIYPACYFIERTNYYVVGALDLAFSNKGGPINRWAKGLHQVGIIGRPFSGTSQATANSLGQFIKDLDD